MPANPLIAEEREEVRAGIVREESFALIGRVVGRHRGTIRAEVLRNGGRDRYRARQAQKRCDQQRCRPQQTKLSRDPVLAAHVAKRLVAKDSPMRISIELTREGRGQISHETIYQAIYRANQGIKSGLEPRLHQGLHLKRRRRKHRGIAKQLPTHVFGNYLSISDRPAIAETRTEFGHLEGDQIVGAYNKSALITVFDRMTRHLWLNQLQSKTAKDTLDAMLELLARIPAPLRRTLTWDQGAEMACHATLTKRRHIPIYIADPKSPWQRPTNENGNALVRRYVGKGTDLSAYTTRDLRHIEQRINTIPRRTLNWATAQDHYNQVLSR